MTQCAALTKALTEQQLDGAKLANKAGLNVGRVNDILAGSVKPTQQEFSQIAAALNLNGNPAHLAKAVVGSYAPINDNRSITLPIATLINYIRMALEQGQLRYHECTQLLGTRTSEPSTPKLPRHKRTPRILARTRGKTPTPNVDDTRAWARASTKVVHRPLPTCCIDEARAPSDTAIISLRKKKKKLGHRNGYTEYIAVATILLRAAEPEAIAGRVLLHPP
ncbi:hypothetical protein HD554DRAFT_2040491 [Boletus coccyginus]|nr:hypothetical protein HD554DRAFT_2040491 [Boletus coccyginus]